MARDTIWTALRNAQANYERASRDGRTTEAKFWHSEADYYSALMVQGAQR